METVTVLAFVNLQPAMLVPALNCFKASCEISFPLTAPGFFYLGKLSVLVHGFGGALCFMLGKWTPYNRISRKTMRAPYG
jgi:hypothetical protein